MSASVRASFTLFRILGTNLEPQGCEIRFLYNKKCNEHRHQISHRPASKLAFRLNNYETPNPGLGASEKIDSGEAEYSFYIGADMKLLR